MLTSSYRVRLPGFEGPLDVLLFFVQHREFPIAEVPVSRLVEQFLESMRWVEEADLEGAAEFLVLAAELLAVKLRWLLHRPAEEAAVGEDSQEHEARLLQQRLLEYRRYKCAAAALRERMRHDFIPRAASLEWQRRGQPLLEPLAPQALVEALQGLLQRLGHLVVPLSLQEGGLSVEECAVQLLEAVAGRARVPFRTFVQGRTRADAVRFFLALLELLRQGQLSAEQEEVFGEILLSAGVESTRDGGDGGDAASSHRSAAVCQ